jgi:hypothetical protein
VAAPGRYADVRHEQGYAVALSPGGEQLVEPFGVLLDPGAVFDLGDERWL